jgi:hypothetical protein
MVAYFRRYHDTPSPARGRWDQKSGLLRRQIRPPTVRCSSSMLVAAVMGHSKITPFSRLSAPSAMRVTSDLDAYCTIGCDGGHTW